MDEKDSYAFDEALGKIEEFMKEAGVRNFCSSQCKGHCCGGCYTTENACHKHEGRRIMCSMYICSNLQNLVFTEEQHLQYERISSDIWEFVRPYYTNRHGGADRYFRPPTRKLKRCRIPKTPIDKLREFPIEKMSNKMHLLRCLGGNIRVSVARDFGIAGVDRKLIQKTMKWD